MARLQLNACFWELTCTLDVTERKAVMQQNVYSLTELGEVLPVELGKDIQQAWQCIKKEPLLPL